MIEFVISDLIENISLNAQSILFGAVVLVSYLILRGIYFKVRNKKPNLCIYRIFSVYLFLCYIVFVLYMVLLSREAGSRETVNLKILVHILRVLEHRLICSKIFYYSYLLGFYYLTYQSVYPLLHTLYL